MGEHDPVAEIELLAFQQIAPSALPCPGLEIRAQRLHARLAVGFRDQPGRA